MSICRSQPLDAATNAEYERCKDSHRCNRAFSPYVVSKAYYVFDPNLAIQANTYNAYNSFTQQAFPGGNQVPAHLFSDFESWEAGTHGWKKGGGYNELWMYGSLGGHFQPLDFFLSSKGKLHMESGTITFNTLDTSVSGDFINAAGFAARKTDANNNVIGNTIVYSFDSVYLTSNVTVNIIGNIPIAILSLSSIYIDTSFILHPGTLGGFPGGIGQLYDSNNNDISYMNVNGPGSGNVRVYLQTVQTTATVINEVQTITTFANVGQTLGGGFSLSYKGDVTKILDHHASAAELKREIEASLPHAGIVSVWVSNQDSQEGFTWTVTFVTAIGNIPKLIATSYLTGIGSGISTSTVVDGNNLGGTFMLSFLGGTTQAINYDASASDVQSALEKVPLVLNAQVTRNDPYNNCDAGLCPNGPDHSWGYIWTIVIATYDDNNSPASPDSYMFRDPTTTGATEILTSISQLTGVGALITIYDRNEFQNSDALSEDIAPQPFSLAYGGAGGGYGGNGGLGHGYNPPGPIYGDEFITDLYGGSGGSIGGKRPVDILPFSNPTGRGGAGGGAIEFDAVNDVVFGPNAFISVNGEDGFGANKAGGGGSGGSIVITCGGTFSNNGTLSANGGNGGTGTGSNPLHGGGGGGGRVMIVAEVYVPSTTPVASISISGGVGGGGSILQNGQEGTLYMNTNYDIGYRIDSSGGVFGTNNCLRLEGGELALTHSKIIKRSPYIYDGPQHLIPTLSKQPQRISYFIRIGDLKYGTTSDNIGGFFGIHETNTTSSTSFSPHPSTMIGVAFIDGSFRHAANFVHDPMGAMNSAANILYSDIRRNRWYKIDIMVNWNSNTYDIRVNDNVTPAINIPFIGSGIQLVGLYNFDAMTVWFDEIYLGPDNIMGFRCPISMDDNDDLLMIRPSQTEWNATALGPYSSLHTIIRHASHLSRREVYQYNMGGLIFGDGAPLVAFDSDIKYKYSSGDHPTVMGDVEASVLTFVPGQETGLAFQSISDTTANQYSDWGVGVEEDASGSSGRYYWYGDHINSDTSVPSLYGGVASCSTVDFINWRNEGIVFHSVNVSTPQGSFSNPLRVQRPKVIYNKITEKFVMWFQVDNDNAHTGYAGVATSDFPNGPFMFNRTFYPDKNETHDQTLIQLPSGEAMLARTYYATVDYVMPQPIMQPLWESVKNADGTVNYGLNFHRAWYEPNYDDYHDIYIQRWRKENVTWHLTWTRNNTIVWEEMGNPDQPGVKIYTSTFFGTPVTVSEEFNGVSQYKNAAPIGQISIFYGNYSTLIQSQDIRNELNLYCCNFVNSNCCNLFLPATHKLEMLTLLVNNMYYRKLGPTNVVDPFDVLDNNIDSCKWVNPQGVGNYPNTQDGTNNGIQLFIDMCLVGRMEPYDDQYSGGSWDSIQHAMKVREEVGGSGYTNIWDSVRQFDGTGDTTVGAVTSRFFDPDNPDNSVWSPSSVPAVITQPWHNNYYDRNIADNPIMQAYPDQLIAMPIVVEQRRSKYVAVSRLSADYLSLTGEIHVFEGEMENNADLVTLITSQFDQFNWRSEFDDSMTPQMSRFGIIGNGLHPYHIDATSPRAVWASDLPFLLNTSDDWLTRFHQYCSADNDRCHDAVNFKNQLTGNNKARLNTCKTAMLGQSCYCERCN